MNHKPQGFMRLGTSILVLVATILITHRTLAAPQPSTTPLPNQNNAQNPAIMPGLSCADAQIRPGAFTKSASNPVLNLGTSSSWEENGVTSPSVLWASGTYRMWYTGTGVEPNYTNAIGYATSTNGIDWTRSASNPVLSKGDPGSWDEVQVNFPSVMPDGTGYKMWYTGTGGGKRQVGYATTPDGIIWTRSGSNPVVNVGTLGSWDATQVTNPSVIKVGPTYHMWYSSVLSPAGGIGHATSPDGIVWTKDAGNPVIPGGSGAWDHTSFAPYVLYDGCWFQMWYSGCDLTMDNCQIGYARSLDGSHWTKRGAVLSMGAQGAFDSDMAAYPSVMLGIPYFRMFYTGSDVDGYNRIGLAIAMRLDKELFLPSARK